MQARIAQDAAGLYERIGSLGRTRDRDIPEIDVLQPWVQAFSPHAPAALLHRLEWDGLDLATVLQATADPRKPRALPEWIAWLPRFADAARSREETSLPSVPALPFVELWLPVARAARTELQRRLGRGLDVLGPAALDALARQLLKETSSIAEQAAYEGFRAFREGASGAAVPEPGSRQHYDAYVAELLADGLASFHSGHPVAARLLAVLAETWVASVSELVTRLAADRDALAAAFAPGTDLGRVEGIDAGLGDRHHGGRRVMVLTFAGGRRIVYKPRDVGVERAYSALLHWAGGRGLEVPRPLCVIERAGYGWMEFASPADGGFVSRDAVRLYYRRSGAVLCLAHVLRGRDLHMENVVASPDGPHLVDAEMLLQPEPAAPGTGGRAEESFLGTGLLSLIQGEQQSGVFDVGGLRGAGGGRAPIARRAWKETGTDAIHFVRDPRFEATAKNAVVQDGVPQPPETFVDDVAAGFTATHRFLREHAAALLAPGGPLDGFAGKPVRVLFRTSTQYGALQYVLTAPAYQRSGLRRSFALEALNRGFSSDEARPLLWPLVADERHALEQVDIPRFTIDSLSTTVHSSAGEPITGHFRRSGLEAVADRVRALSDEDLAEQIEALRLALGSSVHTRFETAPPAPAPADEQTEAADPDGFVAHARWIGAELVARGLGQLPGYASRRAGAGPLHLYDGAAGPVLFLSALAAVTGEAHWGDAARTAAEPIVRFFERRDVDAALEGDEPIGGAGGLASVAYALGVAGDLAKDGAFQEAALRIARLVTSQRIAADTHLDVVGGSAGAALALHALHRLSGEAWLAGRAAACGRRLLETAVPEEGRAMAWPAADGRLLAGFGHGAAGIAYALAQVAEAMGDERALDAARAAYRYERGLFSEAHRNWPVLVLGKGRTPEQGARLSVAWCHGSPGIGLGRALGQAVLDDDEVSGEIEAALLSTLEAPPGGSDHLCCGRLGRADVLLTVGLAQGRADWVEAGRMLAASVCLRATEDRRFALPFTEFDYRVHDPGFFRGLSGIGYALLRMARPARVPSILGFQVPENNGGPR